MLTLGFTISYSDYATVGVNFPYPSTYLCPNTAGDLVYIARDGSTQWWPGMIANALYPISALRIVASGTVNGTPRTTTASNVVYGCESRY